MDELDELPIEPEDALELNDLVDDGEGAYIEMQAAVYDQDKQDRMWLKACSMFLDIAAGYTEKHNDNRPRYAVEDAIIAACERAARIFRSDLPPIGYGDDDESAAC